ncbi:MAG: acetylglutamate kinase [Phycisphaerae bacterium]|nr:acetylglutamate kinase [Phycisphaerae bacterium]
MEQAIPKAAALIEALGYIQKFRGKRVVVKMGGTLMDDPKAEGKILTDVLFMATVGIHPIVVHGGGKEISRALAESGFETRFVQGRRYTDKNTLTVAEHILCNVINARLVAALNRMGGKAMGLHSLSSGVLSGEQVFLQEEGRRIDVGLVGKVTHVNAELLRVLCNAGTVPVIAPIAYALGGGKLNVNADEVAGEVAAAVAADKLVVVSDTHGIRRDLNDPNSQISEVTGAQIKQLIDEGVISGGMLPKVAACLRALEGDVGRAHIIDGRIDHALLLEIYTDKGIGTLITKDKP